MEQNLLNRCLQQIQCRDCSYHPQSQGQVENLNRRVKNCLRHFLLQHPKDEWCDEWPGVVKEIEYFLNHSWHHTVRSIPYAVFFGRFELKNVGKVPVQPEFMEEDFMYAMDSENDFDFNLHALQRVTVPDYTRDNQAMALLACKQSLQEEQKRDTFEATEATITRNRRSQVKKLRYRNLSVGDTVLFKNPKPSMQPSTFKVVPVVLIMVPFGVIAKEYRIVHDANDCSCGSKYC